MKLHSWEGSDPDSDSDSGSDCADSESEEEVSSSAEEMEGEYLDNSEEEEWREESPEGNCLDLPPELYQQATLSLKVKN